LVCNFKGGKIAFSNVALTAAIAKEIDKKNEMIRSIAERKVVLHGLIPLHQLIIIEISFAIAGSVSIEQCKHGEKKKKKQKIAAFVTKCFDLGPFLSPDQTKFIFL